jgi:ribonuclease E
VPASLPVVDPAADAIQSVAEAGKTANALESAAQGGNADSGAESGGRRRRGRRGGRRRRNKQGMEGAASGDTEALDDEDAIDTPLQSQPEFDFADTQSAATPTPVGPVSPDSVGTDDKPGIPRASAPVVVPAPIAVEPTALAVDVVKVEIAPPVANEVVVEPAAPVANEVEAEPAPIAIETPVANQAVVVAPDSRMAVQSTPDAVETPLANDAPFVAPDSRMAVQAAVVADESATPEPDEAATQVEAGVQANLADDAVAVSNAAAGAESDAETPASREETPLA